MPLTRYQGDGVRASKVAPFTRRWPLLGLAVALLALMAASALAWSWASPAGAQDGGLQVSVSANPASPPVNQPTTLTAAIANPPPKGKPAYDWQIDFGSGNWFSAGSNSTLRYLAGEAETLGFRVTVSYGTGETAASDPITVTWVEAGEEPTPEPTEEPTPTPEPTPEPTPVPTEEPPGAPAGLTATGGDAAIELSWTDPADRAISKYQVRMSADGGAGWDPDWADISGSGAATTSHTLTGLTNDTEYTIELRALRGETAGASASARSIPRAEPPPAPDGLTATGRDAAIELRWSDPSDSAISGYQVRVSADGGAAWDPDWTDIPGSGAATTSHILTGLTNDTSYTVELRALRGAASAGPAARATATPSEPAPAEEPTPIPEPTPSAQDGYEPDPEVIDDVWEYAKETDEGHVHVLRWMRVLKTLSALGDMTAAQAQEHADTYWNVRWDPVVEELLNLESAAGDYEPDQDVVDDVRGYAEETGSGFDHVLRWVRVLKTFGAIADITAAEAQGYADQYSAERWNPVVEELKRLEALTTPNRAPVVNTQAANYAGLGDNKVVNYAGFIGNNNAPRGVMVWKKMEGIFTDPDGDELTYTVSFTSDRSELVNWVKFSEATQRVWIEMDGDMSWKSVRPALPNPLITTVTLTATDPEGLSASVSGNFSTRWGIYPEVVSAVASAQAIELTFDLEVESDPAPRSSQFTVRVVNADGTEGTVAVSGVAVNGKVVTLELGSALEEGQTVTLDYYYGYQGGTPLQQAGGGDYARNFSGRAVALTPPGQPQNFAFSATPGSLDLSAAWDALEGATSYKLAWRPAGGEFEAANETTVTETSATVTVSGYGQWEVQLQACNDAGCGAEVVSQSDVEPAPESAAAGLRLSPALDADGKLRPLTIAASWNAVPGAASYTLRWWRDEADSPAEEQPDAARRTRAAPGASGKKANSQDRNQLTVPADRTGAEFTVPEGGRYRVRLRVNGEDGSVIGQDDNQMEVRTYQRGHVVFASEFGLHAITGIEAEPVDDGVKVSWDYPIEASIIINYQYRVLHSDDWAEYWSEYAIRGYASRGWKDAPATSAHTTSYTVTGLDAGETYAVWLRAKVRGGFYGFQYRMYVTTPQYVTVDPSNYGNTDYDTDDDGLIEIADAHQLNAIRWDLDGDGTVAPANLARYGAAFPGRLQGMGCPASGCIGYEIGTGAAGEAAITIDLDVAPYNTGAGWNPMGAYVSRLEPHTFGAILEGNGNVIDNLFINSTNFFFPILGLFSDIGSRGKVRNLGLTNVNITGASRIRDMSQAFAGALTGQNEGLVSNCHSTGTVSLSRANHATVGGLVGYNRFGKIHASHSSVSVSVSNIGSGKEFDHDNDGTHGVGGNINAGGLVGNNWEGEIAASYATGSVTATNTPLADKGGVGGLVGHNFNSIRASYSTGVVTLSAAAGVAIGGLVGANRAAVTESYYDSETSGQSDTGKGVPKTTAELQSPTSYTGIYANWNLDLDGDGNADDPWNFGTSSEYPTLN